MPRSSHRFVAATPLTAVFATARLGVAGDAAVADLMAVILEEAFGVVPRELFPEASRPETVGALAALTGATVPATVQALTALLTLAENVGLDPATLAAAPRPLLLDVSAARLFARGAYPDALPLTDLSFAELLPRLQAAPQVATLAETPRRALSAALYLRRQGVAARALLTTP